MQTSELYKIPLKLLSNRVYRSYKGGKFIDEWQGKAGTQDGYQPEEWAASLVQARNSIPIPNEGLSEVLINNKPIKLTDLIAANPAFYLGKKHTEKYGANTGVLTKVLDAAVRLSIQVHPTKAFSRKYFNSEFGKTEAWYIIGGRNLAGQRPYVLAGFKPGITRSLWKKYFEDQNVEAMIDALHKFYVKPGEVILIEGGFPHAIGSGCFLIEIQEPTDYTMRVEKTAFDGSRLPDILCHQGVGFDHMLDCFIYETLSYEETYTKCFKKPATMAYEKDNSLLSLLSEKDTPCFSMNKLIVTSKFIVRDTYFKTCIVLSGSGYIDTAAGHVDIKKGEIYFLPAGMNKILFTANNSAILECILCYPPSV